MLHSIGNITSGREVYQCAELQYNSPPHTYHSVCDQTPERCLEVKIDIVIS